MLLVLEGPTKNYREMPLPNETLTTMLAVHVVLAYVQCAHLPLFYTEHNYYCVAI